MNHRLREKLKEKKGETLIEVVLSVAVFTVVIIMAATMYAGSMKGIQVNYRSEKKMDQIISNVVKGEETPTTTTSYQLKFSFSGSPTVTKDIELQGRKIDDSKEMYKFVPK